MHIHELNPWRTLIALSAFVFILIIGFVFRTKPTLTYDKSISESVNALAESEAYFYPWELDDVINTDSSNVVLFDIRDNFLYGQGHIPGAENISANDLSQKDNIERLEKLNEMGVTVVLYGEDELQANGPWMVFHQVGFDNIKLLLGGYSYYKDHKDDLYSTVDDDAYFKGFSRYDYAEMAAPKDGAALASDTQNKPVQVQRRQKSNVAAGGC